MPTYKLKIFLPIVILAFSSDWLSKWWASQIYGGYRVLVPGVLRIHLVHNRGGALDWLLPSQPLFWHLLTLIGCALIAIWAWRTRQLPAYGIAGLAMLWGGLFANGAERFWFGHVTDFIETPFTPIINLADLWVIFATILIWVALFMQPDPSDVKES